MDSEMKFIALNTASLLASLACLLLFGPFPSWAVALILAGPLVVTNMMLLRQRPASAVEARRKTSPLVYVFLIAVTAWFAFDKFQDRKLMRLFDEGKSAYEKKDYGLAEADLATVAKLAGRSGGSILRCKTLNFLGNAQLEQARNSEAVETFAKATEACAASRNPNDLIAAYSGLGLAYDSNGRYETAGTTFRRGIELARARLSPNDPQLATVLNNLGMLEHRQHKYSDAEAHIRDAISIWETSLGPESAEVGRGYSNLGYVLLSEGKLQQAGILFNRALAILEKRYGMESPELSWTQNNLAILYEREKKYAEAAELLLRAIANAERAPSPNPESLKTLKQSYHRVVSETSSHKAPIADH
jgi:tetratricopeptide (TPR) repeat protein